MEFKKQTEIYRLPVSYIRNYKERRCCSQSSVFICGINYRDTSLHHYYYDNGKYDGHDDGKEDDDDYNDDDDNDNNACYDII